MQEAAHEAEGAEESDDAEEGDRLTISFPKDGFTDGSIENLRKLVESKATLIKKALGADRITIDTDGDRVSFPWWDRQPEPEETQSYMAFLAALCKMAKEAKRVTLHWKRLQAAAQDPDAPPLRKRSLPEQGKGRCL